MNRLRAIGDYTTLLGVRRRRGTTLAQALALARLEHRRCADEQSACSAAALRCRVAAGAYAAALISRTRSGRAVVLHELQAGRLHALALDATLRSAEAKLAKAVGAVADAAMACAEAVHRLRQNEAHMESLASHLAECRQALARAKEESEDEESTDLRLQRTSAAS